MKVKDKLKKDDNLMVEGISALLMAILVSNNFIELNEDEDLKDHKLYNVVCKMVHEYINTDVQPDEQDAIDQLFEESNDTEESKDVVLKFDDTLLGQHKRLLSIMGYFDEWLSKAAHRYTMDKDDVQGLIMDLLRQG